VYRFRETVKAMAVFHRKLIDDHRTDAVAEARAHVDRHVVQLADLDRSWMDDAGSDSCELEHFVVLDVAELARGFHNPWVRGEDAVDVGVDLACLRHSSRG